MLKIDLFILGGAEFDEMEMTRRRRVVVRAEGAALWLKSPEDTILRELLRYREGAEVSERQWRDVLGVFRVSGTTLDRAYLDESASKLSIADLLARALREAS